MCHSDIPRESRSSPDSFNSCIGRSIITWMDTGVPVPACTPLSVESPATPGQDPLQQLLALPRCLVCNTSRDHHPMLTEVIHLLLVYFPTFTVLLFCYMYLLIRSWRILLKKLAIMLMLLCFLLLVMVLLLCSLDMLSCLEFD